MLPYIIVFLLTILTTYLADKFFKRNHKILGWCFLGIGMFVLSFLAAVRDDKVGKDIITYIIPPFTWAIIFPFNVYMNIGSFEKGYSIIVYICAKLFKDYHYILFIIQFITVFAIFLYSYKKRNKTPMVFIIFIYLFMYYNETLTIMRQGMAMALILLSILFLQEKKYIKTFILYILAIMFHTTSVISIILYFIIIFENSNILTKRTKILLYIIMFLSLLIGITFIKQIFEIFIIQIPIFPARFLNYFYDYVTDEYVFSKFTLLFKVFWIFIALCLMNFKKKNREIKIALIFLLIDISIYIASFTMQPLMRLGMYFAFPAMMILAPNVVTIFKENSRNKIIVNTCIVSIIAFWWLYSYILYGEGGGTYPYTSEILKQFLL